MTIQLINAVTKNVTTRTSSESIGEMLASLPAHITFSEVYADGDGYRLHMIQGKFRDSDIYFSIFS